MNKELYAKIKVSLIKYDFAKSTTFKELWHFSRQFDHQKSFKQFVKIVQSMGVGSRVGRNESGKLIRQLYYDPSNDKYLKGEIKALEPCKHCKGTGMVETSLKVK